MIIFALYLNCFIIAEQTTRLRSLSVEERRDLLSRIATGELTVTRYTNDGEIEEGPGFNIRLAAIIELNRMDEKLPPPKPRGEVYIFPGKDKFIASKIKEGFTEEEAEAMARERITKAGYKYEGDVVTWDG